MKESLLQKVFHHLFGYRYYLVVSNRRGTMNVGVHENIMQSREEARKLLMGVDTFQEVEIISFRSRERYVQKWDDTLDRYVNTVL